MHFKSFLSRTLILVATGAITAACQYSPDMADRSLSYNRSVAISTDQLLLLNIVRSAQRLPTHYSRLEGDTAAAGLTPSFSLTQPFGHGRTLESDVASGALTLKDTAALSAISGLLGLQGSESNSLNLQTLDDQKYQLGIMSPVPLKYFKIFVDDGYPPDLLAHLFVNRIRFQKSLLAKIDAAVRERCGQLTSVSPEVLVVHACASRYDLAAGLRPPPGGQTASGDGPSLVECMPDGVKENATIAAVDFMNDPAHIIDNPNAKEPACFETAVLDLLILGITVNSKPNDSYKFVDGPISQKLATDPHFRAQVIQQGYTVLPAVMSDDSLAKDQFVVCQKSDAGGDFVLTFPAPTASTTKPSLPRQRHNRRQPAGGIAPLASANVVSMAGHEEGPAQRALDADLREHTDSGAPIVKVNAVERKCQPDTKAAGDGTPLSQFLLNPRKIEFTSRSFEAMVYYLGEVARAEMEYEGQSATSAASAGEAPRPALVRVMGRPGRQNYYWDTMFLISKRLSSDDVAVSVRDDAASILGVEDVSEYAYAIPKPCVTGHRPFTEPLTNRQKPCSLQHPDNESLVVLTLLNQIWGLQKEQTATPPPAVIIAP
jgi:hypothetical protein